MILRFPMLSILLPMILASVGCIGTESSPSSDEDETANSDDSLAGSDDEAIGASTDHLFAEPSCPVSYVGDECYEGEPPPPSPPPPPPPTNTTASYLDATARAYLAQEGVYDVASVGGTKWVDACSVSAHQGSVTFNSGITKMCSYASPPGWVILETGYVVLENKNNRGSWSVGSANGNVSFSTVDFGSKFSGAIDHAISVGDISAKQKLELEYQRLNGYSYLFTGTGNNLVAVVTANGGLFKSSSISILAKAKLLHVY